MTLAQDAMFIGGAVLVGVLVLPKLIGSLGAGLGGMFPSWDDIVGGGVPDETPEARAARLALTAQQDREAAEREAAYQAQVIAEAAHTQMCAELDPYSRDMVALSSCHMPLLPLPVVPEDPAVAYAAWLAYQVSQAALVDVAPPYVAPAPDLPPECAIYCTPARLAADPTGARRAWCESMGCF